MSKRERRRRRIRRQAARRRSSRQLAAGAGLGIGAALAAPAAAQATDFTVTSTADDGGGADTTLREAILLADNGGGNDRVLFQAGLSGEIFLGAAGQLPAIDEPLEVLGPAADLLRINAHNATRIFSTNTIDGDDVTIAGLTLTGGNSGGNVGGAILSQDSDLTVRETVVSGNIGGDDGGGLYQSGGSATIQRSTFSGNSSGDDGGGIKVRDGTLTIQNSTISGNFLFGPAGQYGGGVNSTSSTLAVQDSTISGNTADYGGGMYATDSPVDPSLANTVVANNIAPALAGPELHGNAFDASFSLIEVPGPVPVTETVPGSNVTGVNPELGMLADNGGPTMTHRPADTSPALDQGSSVAGTDQRSEARPFDVPGLANSAAAGADGSDIGAVELSAADLGLPTRPGSRCAHRAATIEATGGLTRGTAKGDVIVGSRRRDVIRGRSGRDRICGLAGNDRLLGGGSRDLLKGGKGRDRLLGQAGRDRLVGGPGRDRLRGGPGRDKLKGGPGRDRQVQ